MPDPSNDPKLVDLALEALGLDDEPLSCSGPKVADELLRIVELNQGAEIKAGQAEPSGQVVLELTFGNEGAKRAFVFADKEQAEKAFLMVANEPDSSAAYSASEIRLVP